MTGQRKAAAPRASASSGKGLRRVVKEKAAQDAAPEKRKRAKTEPNAPSRSTCSICGGVGDATAEVARWCPSLEFRYHFVCV